MGTAGQRCCCGEQGTAAGEITAQGKWGIPIVGMVALGEWGTAMGKLTALEFHLESASV